MALPWSLVLLLSLALLYVTHVSGSSDGAFVARLQLQMQQHEEVRERLAALQSTMMSIEAVTRELQDRVAARDEEIAQLQQEHAAVIGRLELCHAQANESSQASLAVGSELVSNLARMEALVKPDQGEMAIAIVAARMTVENMQRRLQHAAESGHGTEAAHASATPPAQEQLIAQPASEHSQQGHQAQHHEHHQQQQADQVPHLDEELPQAEQQPPIALEVAPDAVDANEGAPGNDQPPPAAATPALAYLPEEKVREIIEQAQQQPHHRAPLSPYHTNPPPEDAAHPAGQLHFVKELPLHLQPEHTRPVRTLDDAPPAPFPEEYKEASVAAMAAKYITGLPESERAAEELSQQRAAEVRAEFQHAWQGYKKHAWGFDELHPVSGRGSNSQYHMSLTMIDALDTLVLLGFEDEYREVRDYLQHYLLFTEQEDINLFETTIRLIGGLLAAHALTGDAMFVHQAEECARGMLVAFNTPTGLPYGTVGLRSQVASNPSWSQGSSSMSEVGTIQLEWSYLSHLTGDAVFKSKVDAVTEKIAALNRDLYPMFINVIDGRCTNNVLTFGARTDSIYEYHLKSFVQSGLTEETPGKLYQRAMRAMESTLVRSTPDGPTGEPLTFVAEMHGTALTGKMDHLVCFVPGMLALGAHAHAVPPAEADRHMKLAAKLMRSCYEMYARTATGLAPEIVQFELDPSVSGRAGGQAFRVDENAAHSLIRPETVESLFVLYRTTRDPVYREWGWAIFEALRRQCRVPGGYSGLKDVRRADRPESPEAPWSNHNDKMESFALAETFKYLWLLFQPAEGLLSLDEWVLNTEAHPLPILNKQKGEKHSGEDDGQMQQQQQQARHLLAEQLRTLRGKSEAHKQRRAELETLWEDQRIAQEQQQLQAAAQAEQDPAAQAQQDSADQTHQDPATQAQEEVAVDDSNERLIEPAAETIEPVQESPVETQA